MWNVLLWTLFLLVSAWIFYNAWRNRRWKVQGLLAGVRSPKAERSVGEKIIAGWLKEHKVPFEQDKPVTVSLSEPPFRPNFTLAERKMFIEYYGASQDPKHALYRQKKDRIYEQKGWNVVKVTTGDLDRLDEVLGPALGISVTHV
jgi:very-short-patch-repair endonuclease